MIGRRDFITLLGGAAATWPLAASAQQPAVPVIGFLSSSSANGFASRLAAFRQGLKEEGYLEGQNVAIEYRWADDDYERLPSLAADLVGRRVAVIAATGGTPAPVAAKQATQTIPIIFAGGGDPVKLGFVASLNRPRGNMTGVVNLAVEIGPKRLELLHEASPNATMIGLLINRSNPGFDLLGTRGDMEAAAKSLGLRLHELSANTEPDLAAAFVMLSEIRAGGLVIGPDPFLTRHAEELAALTVRHAIPTIFQTRDFAVAGGLMSYGADLIEQYRLSGNYAGRVLKGERPADLAVQQATKVELIINLKTANALGLTVPPTLLARADEVIE
jgi:putative ABC transport system substrate-binding protein